MKLLLYSLDNSNLSFCFTICFETSSKHLGNSHLGPIFEETNPEETAGFTTNPGSEPRPGPTSATTLGRGDCEVRLRSQWRNWNDRNVVPEESDIGIIRTITLILEYLYNNNNNTHIYICVLWDNRTFAFFLLGIW